MAINSGLPSITPAEAAEAVGVGVQSIRRWCEWHAFHLSAGASPGPGIPRRLNGRDVEVLKQVKDLRYQGLQTEAVNKQLAGITFAVVDTDEQSTADSEELAPVATQEGPSVIMALEAMRTEIATIRVIASEAKQGQRDGVTWFAMGFIAAGIFFLIIVVMAWLYGGMP